MTAYAWFNIAAADGYEAAAKIKGSTAKAMTPDQIAEGQRLSRDLLRQIEATKAGKPKEPEFGFAAPRLDPRTGLPINKRK